MRISLSVFFTLHIVPDTVPGKLLPELVAEQYCLSQWPVQSLPCCHSLPVRSQEPPSACAGRSALSRSAGVSRVETGATPAAG